MRGACVGLHTAPLTVRGCAAQRWAPKPGLRETCPHTQGRDIANLTTKTGALLQSLSIFACTNINADPDANYLVGTLSTAAPNVGVNAEALNAIARQFPIKAFGVCMAVQPCSNDYLFGFKVRRRASLLGGATWRAAGCDVTPLLHASRDLHATVRVQGFSMRFPVTIPPLPPAVGEASLNAISVSQSVRPGSAPPQRSHTFCVRAST